MLWVLKPSFLFSILLIFSCDQNKIDKPNIILIIGDDHGYPYFGFMGSEIVLPQHGYACKSKIFTNGYVPDNHCRPALQALITGIDPYDYIQQREFHKDSLKRTTYLDMDGASKEWENNFNYHAMKYFNTVPKALEKEGYKAFKVVNGKYHYKYGGFRKE